MGKAKKQKQPKHAKQAHHVPGPLAKWRLSIAVAASALTTGMPLLDATQTGEHLDLMLGRSLGAACLVYIALGKVNRMLAAAAQQEPLADAALDLAADGDATFGDGSFDPTRAVAS